MAATPITFTAVQDASASSATPTTNNGTLANFWTDGSPTVKAAIAFNVTGLGSTPAAQAILKVYGASANSGGYTVSSYPDTDWSETGFTYQYYTDDPIKEGPVVGKSGAVAAGAWTSVDVTSLVQGDGLVSFMLNATNTTSTKYSSRESGATTAPQLVVTPAGTTPTPTPTPTPTATPTPPPSSDPVIAAAGDIACDPSSAAFNFGNGNGSSCRQLATATLINGIPNLRAVLALGDNQYYCGGLSAFQQSYDKSWGAFKAITKPAIGNHELLTSGGTGCDSSNLNGAGYFNYFGAAAGTPGQGWYSYDVGAWHLIALNSNCSMAGGCGATSTQGKWLANDLAAHPNRCTLAYWHAPLYSQDTSGGHATTAVKPLWDQLLASGVELVLNGHSHNYERYRALNSTGGATAGGIVEVIAGTGGANHTPISTTITPTPLVANTNTFGALKLTLHAGSADGQFLPAQFSGNGTFTDSFSVACH
jgi:hypothetical protein